MNYSIHQKKLQQIKLLLLDVDGVLTDGSIIYNDDGTETKVFNVKDGLGIRLLMDSGIAVGIVTGRASNALLHRCKNLGISYIFDNVKDKVSVFNDVLNKTGLLPEQTAFMGDDLPDISVMKKSGLAIAVFDAHKYVKENADIVTQRKGGKGAVREICEQILKSQGFLGKIKEQFENNDKNT